MLLIYDVSWNINITYLLKKAISICSYDKSGFCLHKCKQTMTICMTILTWKSQINSQDVSFLDKDKLLITSEFVKCKIMLEIVKIIGRYHQTE